MEISMTDEQLTLWEKIRRFELDDISADFCFSDRLARENSWSKEYALRSILEYKKFMLLICIADHPLTPSDQVDQVWHLHMIYTQSYWQDFCTNTLGEEIHHGPTKGGGGEKTKFNNWYERCKELYKETFSKEPPVDIWPSAQVRFREINFSRVNHHKNWVIPKPKFLRKWKF